jgi:CubicO group peptidase (beta-lactamase class C family)
VQSGIPNAPDTEYRIDSITKQFTAMAILELEARGKLSIQDPVCKYVPDCPGDWGAITIYNLLTHTSGIPNFSSFPNFRKVETEQLRPTELLALFEDKPLDFTPGSKYSYGNSGYEVLGYIIERVSGESYQEFLEKNIFGPLGMKNSGYDSSHPTAKNHAQGYTWSENGYEPARFVDMSVLYSAGALYSTVLDLYKWDRAVKAGKLIPKDLTDEMLTGHIAAGERGSPQYEFSHSQYGFGWMISDELGHKEIWHGGAFEGFTSINSWYPDDDATIIVLDNVSSFHVSAIGHALASILFGQKYEMPEEHEAITLAAGELEKFVGQYQLNPHFILTVRQDGDQLITQATGQRPIPIYPVSANEFYAKLADAEISFVEGANGKVTGLVLHEYANGHDMPASRISDTAPPTPQ